MKIDFVLKRERKRAKVYICDPMRRYQNVYNEGDIDSYINKQLFDVCLNVNLQSMMMKAIKFDL